MKVAIRVIHSDKPLWEGECRAVYLSEDETKQGNRIHYIGDTEGEVEPHDNKVLITLEKTPTCIGCDQDGEVWIGYSHYTACDHEWMLTFGGGR